MKTYDPPNHPSHPHKYPSIYPPLPISMDTVIKATEIDDFAPLIIQSRETGASMVLNRLVETGYINSATANDFMEEIKRLLKEI